MSHTKQRDSRREAWRRFYLENYPDAVRAVGNEKKQIDAYIAGLWKTIGSKGREAYIFATRNTAGSGPTEKPTKYNDTSDRRHSAEEECDALSRVPKSKNQKLESDSTRSFRKPERNLEPSTVGTSQGPLHCRDVADSNSWPRRLTSRLCQCVMLTRKRIRLSVGELFSLSVSSAKDFGQAKHSSPTIVRLSKDGREFARLDSPFACALGAAIQTNLVDATCSIVQTPDGHCMFAPFYAEVYVHIEREAFGDHNSSEKHKTNDEQLSSIRSSLVRMMRALNIIPTNGSEKINGLSLEESHQDSRSRDDVIESYLTTTNRVELSDAQKYEPPHTLKSDLREYQKAGVHWMISREKLSSATQEEEINNSRCQYPWFKCCFDGGGNFFVNSVTGELRIKNLSPGCGSPRGGILADEMGLGKSIQCIACLMHDFEDTSPSTSDQVFDVKSMNENFRESNESSRRSAQHHHVHVALPPLKRRKREKLISETKATSAVSLLMDKALTTCTVGGTLIVCPTSLVTQWMDELNFHIQPNVLRVVAHYGNMRGNEASISSNSADVIITSYGVLASEFDISSDGSASSTKMGPLFRLRWRRIILDEAHTIKSRETRWAKAAYRLEADIRWCVTGTVIHNHINDVYSLIHFLRLEPWSSWSVWTRTIADPLQSKEEEKRESAMSLVREILSSVTLRRKKSTKKPDGEAIVQMTKKTVDVVSIIPTPEEQQFYSALHARTKMKFNSFVAQGNVLRNYASVLEMLLRLRQACDHPYLVMKAAKTDERVASCQQYPEPSSFESERTREHLLAQSDTGSVSKECPLCLDITENLICLNECGHILCRACVTEALQSARSCPLCRTPTTWKDSGPPRAIARIDPKRWTSSAKIDQLIKDMKERQNFRENLGTDIGKSVVFSQFTSMLDIVEEALRREKFPFLRIDGSVPQPKRAVILKQFSCQREVCHDARNILLLSTRAGGVGLNLTSASFAVLLDIHWNPQVDAQAQDRIHRHGQIRDVLIKRYVVKDSVEEKLLEVQERKEKMAAGAFDDFNEGDEKQARLSELKMLFSG